MRNKTPLGAATFGARARGVRGGPIAAGPIPVGRCVLSFCLGAAACCCRARNLGGRLPTRFAGCRRNRKDRDGFAPRNIRQGIASQPQPSRDRSRSFDVSGVSLGSFTLHVMSLLGLRPTPHCAAQCASHRRYVVWTTAATTMGREVYLPRVLRAARASVHCFFSGKIWWVLNFLRPFYFGCYDDARQIIRKIKIPHPK